MSDTQEIELPGYTCVITVMAMRIIGVERHTAGDFQGVIYLEDKSIPPIEVSFKFLQDQDPQPGDYYVISDNGYVSCNPPEGFLSRYSRD